MRIGKAMAEKKAVKKKPKKKKAVRSTRKMDLFVEYYLSNGYNATLAAKQAGYKAKKDVTFRNIGSENLTKPYIEKRIAERTAGVAMKADEVLSRLSGMAKGFDIIDYVEQVEVYRIDSEGDQYFYGYNLKIDDVKLQADGHSWLIKEIRQTRDGMIIKWHDAMAALIQLGKNHKLFTEKHEFEGTIATSTAEAVDALRKAKKELGGK